MWTEKGTVSPRWPSPAQPILPNDCTVGHATWPSRGDFHSSWETCSNWLLCSLTFPAWLPLFTQKSSSGCVTTYPGTETGAWPLFFILFLAALGLCCCTQAFSHCDVYTSHCNGFSCCGVWAPGCADLVAPWHVGSSQARDTTRTLLCWQEDSKPLDHQGSPAWPLFLTHPSSFMNHPWPNCAYFTTKIFLYSFHHLRFCSHCLNVSSQWTQQPFKCPP